MFTLNPHDKDFLDTLDLLIKVIAGSGGLYLFCLLQKK